jgi:secondary thiamine-phosphate synthase enzyme
MTIKIKTYQKTEIIDITGKVEREITGTGLVNIYVKHTTTAVTVTDLDPGSDTDFLNAIKAMTPAVQWIHPHNPSHYPDHLFSSLIGVSLTLPFIDGKLQLGEWQRIVFIELDGAKDRELILTFIINSQ